MNINRSVCTVYCGEANCAGNPIQKVETQASERFNSEKQKLFMRSLVFFVVFVTVLCGFTGTDAARGQGQRPKAKEVEVEMGEPEWWWWNMILATVDSIKFGLHCTMFENEATSASA